MAALDWLKIINPLYENMQVQAPNVDNQNVHDYKKIYFEESMAAQLEHDFGGINIEEILNGQNVTKVSIPKCSGRPVDEYDMANGKEMAFPWFFSNGKSGFSTDQMGKKWLSPGFLAMVKMDF